MPSLLRRFSAGGLALALLGLAPFARGAEPESKGPSTAPSPEAEATPPMPNGPGWAFGAPGGEVALASFSLLALAAYALPQQASGWGPAAVAPHEPAAASLSNVTGAFFGTGLAMAGGLGLEFAYYRSQRDSAALVRALRSTLVEAEALALTSGLTGGLKALTGRCRPRASNGVTCVGGEYDAFPSGHTSTIASVAGVRLVHALRSGGGATARHVSLALAEAATLATGVLRVAAGAHSWDDVLGGFLLGHGIGALVALAHPWEPTARPPSAPVPLREIPGAAGPTELPLAGPTGAAWGGAYSVHF